MTWDTYALLATSPSTRWGLKDIIPVALMIKQPSSFLTAANGPLKTWADVEREARTRPLKVAVTGFGSPDDITVNFFVARGLKLIPVPFANPGERYTAVLGGHADILYEQIGDVRSFVDSKQIQPVIVFADKRFGVFPDVPASKELGYDITLPQRRAVIMKAGTDPQRVKVIAECARQGRRQRRVQGLPEGPVRDRRQLFRQRGIAEDHGGGTGADEEHGRGGARPTEDSGGEPMRLPSDGWRS